MIRSMNIQTFTNLSPAPLAASATFTAPQVRAVAGVFENEIPKQAASYGSNFDFFRVLVASDQAGTLNIQQSPDGTTWVTTLSQSIPANAAEGTVVESIPSALFIRAQVVNGATAQTTFILAQMTVAR